MTRDDKIQLWQVQKESGMTIVVRCELNHVTSSNLCYWQKKLIAPAPKTESMMVSLPMMTAAILLIIETPSSYRISVNDTSALNICKRLNNHTFKNLAI
ncbi:hypothetical protein [Photobacterium nomapromontoriensis]|uniref:hypothetical protein n=1 Tax=Photobacterium nomapromontoriensis TaxID=2910237 RepID=UPI003D1178B5